MFVLWCNGSTTGFGSVCGGSNPPRTTFVKRGSSSKEWLPLLRYTPPRTATHRYTYTSYTPPRPSTPLFYTPSHTFCFSPFLAQLPRMCAKQNAIPIGTDINQLITFSHKKLLNSHIIFNIDTLTLQCVRENTTFFH